MLSTNALNADIIMIILKFGTMGMHPDAQNAMAYTKGWEVLSPLNKGPG